MSNNLKNRNRQTISRIGTGAAIILAGLCFLYVVQSDQPAEKKSFEGLRIKVLSTHDTLTSERFQASTDIQLTDLSTKIQTIQAKKYPTELEAENLAIWQAQARIYEKVKDLEMRVDLHQADATFDSSAFQQKILRLKKEAQQISHSSE